MIRIDLRSTSNTCAGCGAVDETQLLRTRNRCRCGLDIHRITIPRSTYVTRTRRNQGG